jgi:hypothetical protein
MAGKSIVFLLLGFGLSSNPIIINAQKMDRLNFDQVQLDEITAVNLTRITNDNANYRNLRISLDGKKIAYEKIDQKGIFILDLQAKQESKVNGSEDMLCINSWNMRGISYIKKGDMVVNELVSGYDAGSKVEATSLKGKLIEKDNKIFLVENSNTKVIAPWGKNPEVLDDGSIRYEIDKPGIFIVFDGLKRRVQQREGTPPIFIESPEITCSPEGKFIISAHTIEHHLNIIGSTLEVRKIGDKKVKKIFSNPELIPLFLDWSVDGKKILFVDEKKGQIHTLDINISK